MFRSEILNSGKYRMTVSRSNTGGELSILVEDQTTLKHETIRLVLDSAFYP